MGAKESADSDRPAGRARGPGLEPASRTRSGTAPGLGPADEPGFSPQPCQPTFLCNGIAGRTTRATLMRRGLRSCTA